MFPYFQLLIGFITVIYIIETYISYRQHKNYKIKTIPPKIKKYNVITQEKFEKSQSYGLDKSNFGFIKDLYDQIHNMSFLLLGGLPLFWYYSLQLMEHFRYTVEYEIVHSLVFVMLLGALNFALDLPFDLYSVFVIEERHGFNKQTLRLYIKDKLLEILLSFVIGVPILSAGLMLIKWGGPYFWFYLWLFLIGVTLVMVTIYPTVIAPLFNKFQSVPDGELKDKIYALAKRVDFPLKQLYTVDGSKRSGHSNAYFYGFFKNKRIVLYDTLLEQLNTGEIIAVLAHELGHFKMSHTYKNLLISMGNMLVFLFLFGQSLSNIELYRSFGFSTEPAFIGLTLFSYVFEPVDHVIGFLMHALSRHFEYQADEYAVKLGYDLTESLTKLSSSNLSSIIVDPVFSAYHHTHPTLLERIDYMQTLLQGKKKENDENKIKTS